MYCSSCGSAVSPGLKYCNRCGAQLSSKKSAGSKGSDLIESLVWAIVGVSLGGLGLLIGLMAVMKHELQFENQMILLVVLLSFVVLLAAETVLIWLLLKSKGWTSQSEKETIDITQLKKAATKELDEPYERLLPEPSVSVTDQTTRTLEPVYRNKRSQNREPSRPDL
ncbi:MAG TPA: zinc ribbon domain-containing protein [Pyrinomonadaceae bacterium]|nr:zinc ribbon domain-containing protein [Pyrinomonadaceae bacterium]